MFLIVLAVRHFPCCLMETGRVMSYEKLNYSTVDFVLFEEEIAKCLKKIDVVMGTKNYGLFSTDL